MIEVIECEEGICKIPSSLNFNVSKSSPKFISDELLNLFFF